LHTEYSTPSAQSSAVFYYIISTRQRRSIFASAGWFVRQRNSEYSHERVYVDFSDSDRVGFVKAKIYYIFSVLQDQDLSLIKFLEFD